MSAHALAKLFEPIMIGDVKLKNRIKIPAMAVAMGEDGGVSDQIISFYEERAKGGVGLIGISCTPTELVDDPMQGLYDDKFIPDHKKIVDAIHKHDTIAYAQMGVGYSWKFPGEELHYVSPSGLTATGRTGSPFRMGAPHDPSMPKELSVKEIKLIVEAYGDGARRAKEAGYDIVEVIASVGYITAQFMSPKTNKRTDEYGGSLENRMRFLLEIIADMKKKTDGMPVSVRISGDDMYPAGPKKGYGLQDSMEMSKMLEDGGVDQIDVMAGWHSAPVAMIQSMVPQGKWLYLAEGIKSAVSIPVAGGTQVQDIEVAAQAIADGQCDMVFMARANIADPDLANKARAGRIQDIKPCINCCRCQESSDDPPVYCSVNPRMGREAEYPSATPEPAKTKKKVLVIGGGPSGMEAARVASLKGHHVTIVDQNYQLGGAMLLASIANLKMGPQMRYKIKEIGNLPINVKLRTQVTPDFVKQFNPDAVVVAVGGAPKLPNVPGIDKTIVRSRNDMEAIFGGRKTNKKKDFLMALSMPFVSVFVKYFYNPDLFRKLLKYDFVFLKNHPALLGGGFAGLEMGELLIEAGKQPAALIEESPYIGSDIGPITRWVLKRIIKEHNVPMYKNATIKEITDDGIKIDVDGESKMIKADAVVPTQIVSNTTLYDQLKGMVKEIHAVGDGNDPGKLMEAITSGFVAGNKI